MNGSNKDIDASSSGSTVIKITVPSVGAESDMILDIKLSVATDLRLEFRDILNYGLFLPPANGKAGKFLQEERQLRDYPFSCSVGHLEFKYKQRIYRNLPANINKLRKINSKANLRKFLGLVHCCDLEKVTRLLEKGIDPNFQSRDDGETPLTVAVRLPKPKSIIMVLVAGGAHLDYRAADSSTPLHKAAISGNYEAIKVLLDLGQSPNTRDSKGLTPLYQCMLNDTSAMCAERLLFDRSMIGVTDGAGMEEIHQACRFGRVQHLEQLIAYGANINSQTTFNGNTPLHFCAYNGQESCARLLLFRGANRTLKNRAGHTAHQEAVLANHVATATLIRDFQSKDVGE
ncbi:SH3 and multiple ankyrin repeat domain protein 3 [Taenia solium]|eukprot:TsM_000849100 transcript=TsM_000849100 gene=TsM_000849100